MESEIDRTHLNFFRRCFGHGCAKANAAIDCASQDVAPCKALHQCRMLLEHTCPMMLYQACSPHRATQGAVSIPNDPPCELPRSVRLHRGRRTR